MYFAIFEGLALLTSQVAILTLVLPSANRRSDVIHNGMPLFFWDEAYSCYNLLPLLNRPVYNAYTRIVPHVPLCCYIVLIFDYAVDRRGLYFATVELNRLGRS